MLETEKMNKIGNQLYLKTGFIQNQVSNFYEWTNSQINNSIKNNKVN